jgi:hypothetical protein
MSVLRNSRRRLPGLTCPAAPCRLLDGQPAPFSSGWISRTDCGLACLPSRENNVLASRRSSLCRASRARSLCVHLAGRVTLDGRPARLPSRFGPRRTSLPDVCDERVLSSIKGSMIAVRVPRPFLRVRPRRPRFGVSDRRPSSLKRRLALPPATAGYDFLPLAARASIPRANQESRALAALYCVPAPSGCGSTASGLSSAIEAAMGGPGN